MTNLECRGEGGGEAKGWGLAWEKGKGRRDAYHPAFLECSCIMIRPMRPRENLHAIFRHYNFCIKK